MHGLNINLRRDFILHIKNEKSYHSYHDFGWTYFILCHVFSLETSIVLLVVVTGTTEVGKVIQSSEKYL